MFSINLCLINTYNEFRREERCDENTFAENILLFEEGLPCGESAGALE